MEKMFTLFSKNEKKSGQDSNMEQRHWSVLMVRIFFYGIFMTVFSTLISSLFISIRG